MSPAKLLNDHELRTRDVESINSKEQLISFFGYLGYNVDNVGDVTRAAYNLEGDDIKHRITQVTQIGVDPSGENEYRILLLNVRSVTSALIQTIAQRLRDYPGYYLVILTTNYDWLDFVLMERQVSKSGTVLRPRTLTVNRRNPGIIALRVLKRFTVTESEGTYQWDKLRSAYTLAEWSEPEFNNRALFSDYYLKNRMKGSTSWDERLGNRGLDAQKLMAGTRDRLTKENEQKTRADLIEPLFKLLGFDFKVGESGDSEDKQPDYRLYEPGNAEKPIALALTYKWNRNLDSADIDRDTETPQENPGALVVSLLERGEAAWVIMTNGKLWRLYSATASNKITNYYEIDLEEALFAPEVSQVDAFKYWWLMFRREAFTGFLDRVLTESQEYAKEIGERLKLRIFQNIFGYFAGGFIVDMRKRKWRDADIDRELVFSATMTFLYRLMFVLYAESLELLPVKEESGYGEHSLHRLKHEIANTGGKIEDQADDNLKNAYEDDSTALYDRLRTLFTSINAGSKDINLPVYNGGLFSTENKEGVFLEEFAIPDVYLAIGIDRLARDIDEDTEALVFIDFKSLGVRQLGSIYEGLLEFKLRIAEEELAVIKDGKREIYMPSKQAEKENKRIAETIAPGKVYIENNKRERKATGSYYTPDYIVKYIIEHTVGPVLKEKFDALRPKLRDAQAAYQQYKKTTEATKNPQPPEVFWNSEAMTRLADECLNITVLDPAMGSGHFLVEVVDFISNQLIDFLNAWSDNPVWALIKRTREDILGGIEDQGITIDKSKLTDVVLLKRSVFKHCVYGVDLNLMAVELAKGSLWLDAFTLGAPLSFLDHHLKWGNSLIGARLGDVYQGQLPLFAQVLVKRLERVRNGMERIGSLPDSTIAQSTESKNLYNEVYKDSEPLRRLLDVYTSRWFGNGAMVGKGKKATDMASLFLQDDRIEAWLEDPEPKNLPNDTLLPWRDIAATTLKVRDEKCFFHWELEFPEIFFAPSRLGGQDVQLREDGGFDVVVGNPPYIRVQSLTKDESSAFSNLYQVAVGNYDIYMLFVESALRLISRGGMSGFILPNKFFTTAYGTDLRRLLSSQKAVRRIVDFGGVQIFDAATTYTAIIIFSAYPQPELLYLSTTQKDQSAFGGSTLDESMFTSVIMAADRLADSSWNISSSGLLLSKLAEGSVALGDLTERIGQGIVTSADGIYVLERGKVKGNYVYGYSNRLDTEVVVESEVVHPLLKGAVHMQRYQVADTDRYVLFPYKDRKLITQAEFTSNYPKTWQYLTSVRKELENREDGKMRHDKWYGYVYPKNLDLFNQPKLLVPSIAAYPAFSFDEAGQAYFMGSGGGGGGGYGIRFKAEYERSIYYFLALLNSKITDYFIRTTSSPFSGGWFAYSKQYLEPLPIKQITFGMLASRRAELLTKAHELYAANRNDDHDEILIFAQ